MKKHDLLATRLLGLALLAVSCLIFFFALREPGVAESDVTPVIIALPLGIFLLVTKKKISELGE